LQNQVQELVSTFFEKTSDWRVLASVMAGGLAPSVRGGGLSSPFSDPRAARIGTGLVAEVSVFELSNRALQGGHEPWRFFGAGGLGPGLLASLITFGTLRGMGKAAEGQNILLQKGLQDLGMVLGHQGGHHLGILAGPEGGLADALLDPEG